MARAVFREAREPAYPGPSPKTAPGRSDRRRIAVRSFSPPA